MSFDVKIRQWLPENPRSGRSRDKAIRPIVFNRPTPRETLNAEVARIAHGKRHPYECDLVVHRMDDGVTRFLIKVQIATK
jgi:hypothetical protein